VQKPTSDIINFVLYYSFNLKLNRAMIFSHSIINLKYAVKLD